MEVGRNIIYSLLDPVTGEVRYVGQSVNGLKRPRCHWTPSGLRLDDHCHRWVRKVVATGQVPLVSVLEEVTTPELLNERETYWIARLRTEGARLTNGTDGGHDVGARGMKHTPEWRQLMSEKMKGRKFSDESRRRMSESHKGKKPSEGSAYSKGSIPWNKGREDCFSEEARKLMIAAKLGIHRSDDVKLILSKNNPKSQPVKCLDDGREFSSVKRAAKLNGLTDYQVWKSLAGNIVNGVPRFVRVKA